AAAIVGHHAVVRFDAVLGVDDQAVAAANAAARALGFAHNPEHAVRATRDKLAMREAFGVAGLRQPAFASLSPEDDAGAVGETIGYPCVMKPTGLAASRGVIRVDDPDEARTAHLRIRAILDCAGLHPDAPIVVESFVPGAEIAVEAVLRDGTLEVLAFFDKPDPLNGPYFEESIYTTPSRHPRPTLHAACAEVEAAAAALGLREGPVHAELRLADAGPVVLELAARTIGGLCGRILRFGVDVSLEEVVIRHALGMEGVARRQSGGAGVMMLPIPGRGRLVRIEGLEAARRVRGVLDIDITVPPGRLIEPLPEGDRYLGFAFAAGATPDDAEVALRRAHDALRIVVAPEA
ncbi:MAG TPA: ATP-grasp domain-containing protein, partial [Acidimicrobiales bacterium]|nr:ATP-grasp domain-containing protein [Acidimicrobiales bacterium]